MTRLEILYSLSKNKTNIGDKFIIDGGNREVKKITKQYIHMDNGNYYPRNMFNRWMRIAQEIEKRDEQSVIRSEKTKHIEREAMIMRKEAKKIYDENYREPGINRMGNDTNLKLFIVLTGVGNTIKFYFSPTSKATPEELEMSYQSLHGVKYKAFSWGYYIQMNNVIALLGMYSYKEKNLSAKRIDLAMVHLNKEKINGERVQAKLYPSLLNLLHSHPAPVNTSQLLSSPSEEPTPKQEEIMARTRSVFDSFDKKPEEKDYSDTPF